MNTVVNAWRLPSAAAFLDDVETTLEQGLAVVPGDQSMPLGLEAALGEAISRRNWHIEKVRPKPGSGPATALSDPFRVIATIEGVLSTALTEHVVFLDLANIALSEGDAWEIFLQRFHERRGNQPSGLGILVVGTSRFWAEHSQLPVIHWENRLRRLDATIWADLHAPDRPEPLASLAGALAVELGAWRLDLVAAIVQARKEDLFDPIEWLKRRDEEPLADKRRFGTVEVYCPLALLSSGSVAELKNRIWRAQLTAFFPWLEEQRLTLARKYRTKLVLDEHLQSLGYRDPEDIELGPMSRQLGKKLSAPEADYVHCLARIRNELAHRRPAPPRDLDNATSWALRGPKPSK